MQRRGCRFVNKYTTLMMARAKRIYILKIRVNKLIFFFAWWYFLKESELANKVEITISVSARDKTRAWVPGQGIMGRDVGVYRTGCDTWLSSRLQNHPRSLVSFCLIFSLFSSLRTMFPVW